MSERAVIRAFMQGLVDRAGGVDAAAAIIGARLGAEVSKGSISKRLAGHLDWSLMDVWALQDALEDWCVDQWRASQRSEATANANLLTLVATAMREHGEAVQEAMSLAAGQGDKTKALKEANEALQVLQALIAQIEARPE